MGYQACVAANLDLFAWYNGAYPAKFMAWAIAAYKLSNQVAVHTEDARNIAAEKEAKKASKK